MGYTNNLSVGIPASNTIMVHLPIFDYGVPSRVVRANPLQNIAKSYILPNSGYNPLKIPALSTSESQLVITNLKVGIPASIITTIPQSTDTITSVRQPYITGAPITNSYERRSSISQMMSSKPTAHLNFNITQQPQEASSIRPSTRVALNQTSNPVLNQSNPKTNMYKPLTSNGLRSDGQFCHTARQHYHTCSQSNLAPSVYESTALEQPQLDTSQTKVQYGGLKIAIPSSISASIVVPITVPPSDSVGLLQQQQQSSFPADTTEATKATNSNAPPALGQTFPYRDQCTSQSPQPCQRQPPVSLPGPRVTNSPRRSESSVSLHPRQTFGPSDPSSPRGQVEGRDLAMCEERISYFLNENQTLLSQSLHYRSLLEQRDRDFLHLKAEIKEIRMELGLGKGKSKGKNQRKEGIEIISRKMMPGGVLGKYQEDDQKDKKELLQIIDSQRGIIDELMSKKKVKEDREST